MSKPSRTTPSRFFKSEQARQALDERAFDLLRRGRAWRDEVEKKYREAHVLDAPRVVQRSSDGSLKRESSPHRDALRAEDLKRRVAAGERFPEFSTALAFDSQHLGEAIGRDSSGLGMRRAPATFERTEWGVVHFVGGLARGWTPDERGNIWFLDTPGGCRAFSDLKGLVLDLRGAAKKDVSPEWVWSQVLTWMDRPSGEAGSPLTAFLEEGWNREPASWRVFLRIDGAVLASAEWEVEDEEPWRFPWLGSKLLSGYAVLIEMLNVRQPERDPALWERNADWISQPEIQGILNGTFLEFSSASGDRFKVILSTSKKAFEICRVTQALDSSDRTPIKPIVPATWHESGAVILIGEVPGGESELLSRTTSRLPFDGEPSTGLLWLTENDRDLRRLEAHSELLKDLHLLGKTKSELQEFMIQALSRLGRAREEFDADLRNFLFVSALDGLLIGDEDQRRHGRRTGGTGALLAARMGAILIDSVPWRPGVLEAAYRWRNTYAHNLIRDFGLRDNGDRLFVERAVTQACRRLMCCLSLLSSPADLRQALDTRPGDLKAGMRILDQIDAIEWEQSEDPN